MKHKKSRFAKRAKNDLSNTFFQEFEQRYTLEGREVSGVLTSEAIGNTSTSQDRDYIVPGLINATFTFYIRTKDLPFEPFAGKHVSFNHEEMLILKCEDQAGVTVLTLQETESR